MTAAFAASFCGFRQAVAIPVIVQRKNFIVAVALLAFLGSSLRTEEVSVTTWNVRFLPGNSRDDTELA